MRTACENPSMIHPATTRNAMWGRFGLPLAAAVCLLAGTRAFAVQTNLYYVNSANGANAFPPFLSWATAATNVQEAVDLAEAAVDIANGVFCEVVVTDGVHVVSAAVTLSAPSASAASAAIPPPRRFPAPTPPPSTASCTSPARRGSAVSRSRTAMPTAVARPIMAAASS